MLLKMNLAQMILDATSLFKVEETGIKHQEYNRDETEVFDLSDRISFLKIVPICSMESFHKVSILIIFNILILGYVYKAIVLLGQIAMVGTNLSHIIEA